MSARGDDEQVGYGRPPRSGRFKAGQSGNPLGRPRKSAKGNALLPATEPTSKLLRRIAARPVTVREGEGSFEVPITEAVIMSLAKSAIKGGVLAQRTFLQYQLAQDALALAKKRETFEFWQDYSKRKQVEIAKARAAGRPLPEPTPHPDDIRFDFEELEVRFVGPRNQDEVEKIRREWKQAFFLIEIMTHQDIASYQGIFNPGPEIDVFALLFLAIAKSTPQRFRVQSEADQAAMAERLCLTPARRRAALREQGKAVGLPLDPDRRLPKFDLRQAKLRIVNGEFETFDWSKMKERGLWE